MNERTDRRQFLRDATILGAGLAGIAMTSDVHAADAEKPVEPAAGAQRKTSTSEKPFVMGIIGTGGRGQTVAANFAATPGVAVKYVCDVDDAMLADGVAAVEERLAKLSADAPK